MPRRQLRGSESGQSVNHQKGSISRFNESTPHKAVPRNRGSFRPAWIASACVSFSVLHLAPLKRHKAASAEAARRLQMHAQPAEVKSCALCSRQQRTSGSVTPDPVRCRATLGRMAHKNAPGSAASSRGARARGPFPCQPPGPGILRSPGPLPGPTFGVGPSLGPAAAGGGKALGVSASWRPGVTRQQPSARRAGRDGGGDSAGWEPGTGSAGRPEPSQGAPRGEDSGRCRHPAGKREREARPLTGRATVGQCVRALGAVSARRRAQPPPPNGHVGVLRFRRLFFLTLRKGLRGGPPPLRLSACLGRPPRRLVAASSCPTSSFAARCLPQPRPVSRPRSAAARGLCDRRARSSRRSANMDAVNAFNQEVRGV